MGDTILVAGSNFGAGSSRENVPSAMRAAGIRCVVAKSFARIFHRNYINLGVPAIRCPEAVDATRPGSRIRIEIETGSVDVDGHVFRATALPASWSSSCNLRGTFMTMRALVPLMAGRRASIVNTSSGLGLVGNEQLTVYCASKGGLVLLTKAAALELGPGIRVNALCPGVIDTPLPHQALAGLPDEARKAIFAGWEASHVAGRIGKPEEVAAVAVFLASDEASCVTGAAIPVDSGVTAR